MLRENLVMFINKMSIFHLTQKFTLYPNRNICVQTWYLNRHVLWNKTEQYTNGRNTWNDFLCIICWAISSVSSCLSFVHVIHDNPHWSKINIYERMVNKYTKEIKHNSNGQIKTYVTVPIVIHILRSSVADDMTEPPLSGLPM